MGRHVDQNWQYLSDDKNCHNAASVRCKHCNATVMTHRRIVNAVNHLQKCQKFGIWHRQADIEVNFMERKGGDIRNSLHRHFNDKDMEEIEYLLGMFFFTTGTSFYRVENEWLKKLFRKLNPSAELPDRKALGGRILDYCYARTQSMEADFLKGHSYGCVTSDGWTNVNSDPVVNYMVSVGGKELLLDRVTTETHTAEFISCDMLRVIEKAEKNHLPIAGIVTDNTSANKAAWKTINDEKPATFVYGCVAHGLNLFARDILEFKATRTDVFVPYAKFALHCKEMVKFFGRASIKPALDKLQAAAKISGLVLPAETRWGSYLACFQSIKKNWSSLCTIVFAPGFAKTGKSYGPHRQVKTLLQDENSQVLLDKAIKILTPIDKLIVKFQNNATPMSEVYHEWYELQHVSN